MNNLTEYLNKRRTMIDEKLDTVLPDAEVRPTILHQAMRYSVFSGGKRLRPILCLAASDVFDGNRDLALIPAAAIELLHTYTLIHDDLPCMDDDDERRGQPTSHVVYGEANAILTGDALQALAFEVIVSDPNGSFPAAALAAELSLAAGSRGVIAGQVEDLALVNGAGDENAISFIHHHKTADLFKAAIRMGSITAGAGTADLEKMTSFALALGMAFQVADDLLDREKADDNASCLALYGEDGARNTAEEYIASALADLESINRAGTEPLRAIADYLINREH